MFRRAILCFLALSFLFAIPAFAAAPLLMDGKKSLYQRVIAHPGAAAYASADGKTGAAVAPFTVLYVYARKTVKNAEWLEVSPSTTGAGRFWLPASAASAWKQALVLTFSERAGRDPLLFFATEKDLERAAESKDISAEMKRLYAEFQSHTQKGAAPANFPIRAAEPADAQGAVPQRHFYLMPIFSYSEPFEGTKFLEVGSIDPGNPANPANAGGPGAADQSGNKTAVEEPPKTLRSAIVFAIDTTISMRPYIEQSLATARKIYDAVEKSGHADKVGLGVVAFRSSPEASPGLEYRTNVISPLRTALERGVFEDALGQVREAAVSSHSFNEDSLAGVKVALETMDWSTYQSRIILLLTDAGPLAAGDPYAATRMGSAEIADLARQKRVSIVALHVKSPNGQANHAYAAREYQALTPLAEGQSGYIAIDAATPEQGARQFDQAASALADRITRVVVDTANGKPLQAPAEPTVQERAPSQSAQARAARIGDLLGYSAQLDYLGDRSGARAPQVVHSWIADKDLGRLAQSRSTPTVEVTVLLTKDQLSALRRQLELIVDNAERTKKTDSRDFFQGVLSASAAMSRDPARFAARPDQNLQQLGVLEEWLDGLPYQSDVLSMTEEDWYRMSVGQQTAFINRLKSRMDRYDEYDRDLRNWVNFGSQHPGDWLYRVPLNMLP